MSKADSFQMLKDKKVQLRTFIVRFSHSMLGSVAISYGYDCMLLKSYPKINEYYFFY